MPRPVLTLLVLATAVLRGAEPAPDAPNDAVGTAHDLELPAGFPIPDLSADYPLTSERITLGRALFYDGALSRTGRIMCASCHQRKFAHTDRKRFSTGVEGKTTRRNSMPLFNLAWKQRFFWDGRAPSLRAQVLMPVQDHREMDETLENVVRKLSRRRDLRFAFDAAFGTPEVTPERIAVSLEQFLVARTSHDSKFDRARGGETTLTEQEEHGRELFMTEQGARAGTGGRGAGCASCHRGPLFTDHDFRNNGLKPTDDHGLESTTGKESDRSKFATPSLRNVALTAPYMHDGRFATLAEVVEHYNSGLHRGPTLDPRLARHPGDGLGLTKSDRDALVAFLNTLTDPKFVP